MRNEIWRDIVGFENYYKISNLGRVKSLNRELITKNGQVRIYKGKILKVSPKKGRGYSAVKLCRGSSFYKHVDVHRLVAEHFIPNPDNLEVVNHLDENKSNNDVNNLEWTSYKLNSNHRECNKKRRKPICQFSKGGELLKTWSWAPEVCSEGFNSQMVRKACLNYISTYKGYTWSYCSKVSFF